MRYRPIVSGLMAIALVSGACGGSTPEAADSPASLPGVATPAETVEAASTAQASESEQTSIAQAPTPVPSVASSPDLLAQEGYQSIGATDDERFTYYVRGPGYSRIYVDDGSGPRPAQHDAQDQYLLDDASNFEVDAAGVVTFTHDPRSTLFWKFVGRVAGDGTIRDVHHHTSAEDQMGDHPAFLVDRDAADLEIELNDPLVESYSGIDGTVGGWWYRGATLSDVPRCGASTLYANDADGWRRVLPESVEIDTVVVIHATPAVPIVGADGSGIGRRLVIETACPAEYEGVQLRLAFEAHHGGELSNPPGQPTIWRAEVSLELPSGAFEVRRVLDFVAKPGRVDVGLGSFLLSVEHLDGSTEVVEVDTNGSVVSSSAAELDAALADTADGDPLPPVLRNPVENERFVYEIATEVHPDGVALLPGEGDQTGPKLAVAGFKLVLVYNSPGEAGLLTYPLGGSPEELAAENFVSALASHDGAFYVASGGQAADSELFPPLFRWNAAASNWDRVAVSVTRQATYSAGAAVAATPPSPPWEGASGILMMTAHNDLIWATGWATLDGEVIAALWSSADGTNWRLERLPTLGDGNEYGARLSINDAGVMVGLGNWTHFGAGIVSRGTAGPWDTLPFPPSADGDGSPHVVESDADTLWVGQAGFDTPGTIHWLTPGTTWTSATLPLVGEHPLAIPDSVNRVWSAAHNDGPVAWSVEHDPGAVAPMATAMQWHIEQERFVGTQLPGQYVTTVDGWVVMREGGDFILRRAR